MTFVTQFYKGAVLLGATFTGTWGEGGSGTVTGGTAYPIIPAASFVKPLNFIVPPIIGNYWQWNYAEGFQQPAVDLIFVCRDTGSLGVFSEVLSSTFLNYWLTRSNDAAHDTSAIANALAFWNGRSGFALAGAKAESFTISARQGQMLLLTGRFLFNNIAALTAAPTYSAWDNSAPLIGKNVQVSDTTGGGSILSGKVWDMSISFANNHTPDMSLNGTNLPTDNNAGLQTAGMNFTVQAATTVVPDNNTTSGVSVSMVITGAKGTRTFTLNNPIDQLRDNHDIPTGRVMRQHSYVCLGGDGQTTPPLSIS